MNYIMIILLMLDFKSIIFNDFQDCHIDPSLMDPNFKKMQLMLYFILNL